MRVLNKKNLQLATASCLLMNHAAYFIFIRRFLSITFLIGLCFVCDAQQLVLQGKITFERKENMHKLIDEAIAKETTPGPWLTEMRKNAPKYRIDIFELNFNTKQSLYQITTEDELPFNQRWFRVAYNNRVQSNFETKTFSTQKIVYEKEYRITDTLPQMQWKLTNEYREIAGKNCRKATTILFDSVYIIAFYTDEIPVSGGPENFQGLPGMILGIVIPRIHYNCFATHVQNQVVPESNLLLPPLKRKTQQVNFASFIKEVKAAFDDWGKDANDVFWRVMF